MTKKEFIKMLENRDLGNTTEEWERVYDLVHSEGRVSVLKEFDTICLADAFVGFSEVEWTGIKRFFQMNKEISRWDK